MVQHLNPNPEHSHEPRGIAPMVQSLTPNDAFNFRKVALQNIFNIK